MAEMLRMILRAPDFLLILLLVRLKPFVKDRRRPPRGSVRRSPGFWCSPAVTDAPRIVVTVTSAGVAPGALRGSGGRPRGGTEEATQSPFALKPFL